MATLSPTELLDWLELNQFLAPAQLELLRPLLINIPDSYLLAKELIRRDWLTPYQVNQILQGRHEQLLFGSYRLRERIGEGAMGQVFKAWHPRLEQIVALKTIHKGLINNDKAMERFRREVETASHLEHPNIAHVRDAGDVEGKPFLVMDFIDGFNLSQRVKDQGALPIPEAVEYVRQAALGLQFAFERGIVHRDIKPANLIVTTTTRHGDAQPLVKILDFGLARFDSESDQPDRLTQVGKLLGTIDYISPEQAQNARAADIRADIYSLGCTLYYLLTGQPPFDGKDMVEKLGPRVTGEPPWVRTLRAEVAPDLEAVLRKMMARRPEDRFQTPIEVAQALQPYALPPAMPGVVMALPVSEGADVAEGTVPIALPIMALPAAAPAASIQAAEPAFVDMSATGRAISSDDSAATPSTARERPPFPMLRWALILGSGIACLAIAGCLVCIFSFFGGEPDKKNGAIRITNAKFSMPPGKNAIPGNRHGVLVWIERVDFSGPVKVTLEDLPDGVRSEGTTIPANKNDAEVRFTVSFGTQPITKDIRVVVQNDDAGARAETTLQLVVGEDPKK